MHLFSLPKMRYAGRYQQTGMTFNDIYRLNKIYNHFNKGGRPAGLKVYLNKLSY